MTLVPPKKYYKINEKDFYVTEFGIEQFPRIIGWANKVSKVLQDKIQLIAGDLENSTDNKQDVMTILSLLDVDSIAELLAICLNTDDIGFIKENLKIKDSIAIVGDAFDLNDFGGILKNLTGTVKSMTEKLKNIKND